MILRRLVAFCLGAVLMVWGFALCWGAVAQDASIWLRIGLATPALAIGLPLFLGSTFASEQQFPEVPRLVLVQIAPRLAAALLLGFAISVWATGEMVLGLVVLFLLGDLKGLIDHSRSLKS